MDIYQLKTFVAVARAGSITRASELVHLSQPAVSAHIKAIEDALDLTLFERTARGMSLTVDGERLLAKAERTLAAHAELMNEATRIKGQVSGTLRLGGGCNSGHEAIGKLVAMLAERYPDIEVVLKQGTSRELLDGLRHDRLDAGFYNEAGEPAADLATTEVSTFGIKLVASPGLVAPGSIDWQALAALPWIYPVSSACCGQCAERLFATHHIRPKRIISVDKEDVTRTLIAGGIGVGLLHADTAQADQAKGLVEVVFDTPSVVRVLFARLASRANEPVIAAAVGIMNEVS